MPKASKTPKTSRAPTPQAPVAVIVARPVHRHIVQSMQSTRIVRAGHVYEERSAFEQLGAKEPCRKTTYWIDNEPVSAAVFKRHFTKEKSTSKRASSSSKSLRVK